MAPDSNSAPPLIGIDPTIYPDNELTQRPLARAKFLKNTWYVAMPAEELKEGEIVHRTLLNQPIAFYRKEDGGVAAIHDMCPHRQVPLSMGTLQSGDRVQCIYHGLQFGADGKCVHNPHGSQKISDALHIPSYPVVEKHKLLWIWMGDKPADLDMIPDYSCIDEAEELHITEFGYLNAKCHYGLMIDNLLDLSHICFTHAGILGNPDTAEADPDVTVEGDTVTVSRYSEDAETPGMIKMFTDDPELQARGKQWTSISWYPPSNLLLNFGAAKVGEPRESGTGYLALHWLTPETDRTTHYYYCAARWNVQTDDERNKEIRELIYKMRTFAFADQDMPVIAAQQVAQDSLDHEPQPAKLSIDAGPNEYEKILNRLIAEES